MRLTGMTLRAEIPEGDEGALRAWMSWKKTTETDSFPSTFPVSGKVEGGREGGREGGGVEKVGRPGLEPGTYGLKVRSSTIELATPMHQ